MNATPLTVSHVEATIADTLAELSQLKCPVVRSCHIGNNTSNNYGWLALARNTYMGQLEHTLYGVDEHNFPWAVLGDGGLVRACFDQDGQPQPEFVGAHVSALRGQVPRKYRSLLNFGIFAEFGGEDVMVGHCQRGAKLSSRIGAAPMLLRSSEILEQREILTDLIRYLWQCGELGSVFTRWVRRAPSGKVTMLTVRNLSRRGEHDLVIETMGTGRVFEGSLDGFLELFFAGMEQVHRRLMEGQPLHFEGYPWLTVHFNYLINMVKEYRVDPSQKIFWHAGASGTHYYINEPEFQHQLGLLCATLSRGGFLPAEPLLRIIPTFSCQLFATDETSVSVLEELIGFWRQNLRSRPDFSRTVQERLKTATAPSEVVPDFVRELEPSWLMSLDLLLDRFNSLDCNQLPIAYVSEPVTPSYNKYGISQDTLFERRILIPRNFHQLTWGEAELLVKTLAEIRQQQPH